MAYSIISTTTAWHPPFLLLRVLPACELRTKAATKKNAFSRNKQEPSFTQSKKKGEDKQHPPRQENGEVGNGHA